MSLQMRALPVGLGVKPYPIPPFTVPIALGGLCSVWIGKTVTITWDPAKTTVSSARLIIKAHALNDPIDFKVNFNGVEVRHFYWGEGTKCTEQSDVIDVPIINGTNKLEARACKSYYWPWMAHVDVVEAYIEVTFEGEEPEKNWWEYFWQWWEANWPWIAIGTGLVIVGGAAYMYLARPKS